MYHFYELVKKLCLKLYEHGVVDNSYHDGLLHNLKELVNSSRLFYSCTNDNWRLSHLDHKKRVCQLFVERLLGLIRGITEHKKTIRKSAR